MVVNSQTELCDLCQQVKKSILGLQSIRHSSNVVPTLFSIADGFHPYKKLDE